MEALSTLLALKQGFTFTQVRLSHACTFFFSPSLGFVDPMGLLCFSMDNSRLRSFNILVLFWACLCFGLLGVITCNTRKSHVSLGLLRGCSRREMVCVLCTFDRAI